MIIKILRAIQNKEEVKFDVIDGKYVMIYKDEVLPVEHKHLKLINKALMVVINQLQFEVEDELHDGPHYD